MYIKDTILFYFLMHSLIPVPCFSPTRPSQPYTAISVIHLISFYFCVFVGSLFCSTSLFVYLCGSIILNLVLKCIDIWMPMWRLASEVPLTREIIYWNCWIFKFIWKELTSFEVSRFSTHETYLLFFFAFSHVINSVQQYSFHLL